MVTRITPGVRRQWLADSYAYYKSIIESGDGDEAGVKKISGFHFSNKYPKIVWVREQLILFLFSTKLC